MLNLIHYKMLLANISDFPLLYNNIIFKCTGRDNPITTLTSKEANVIQGFLIQDRKMVF